MIIAQNIKIALVVPTIREDSIKRFLKEWNEFIKKHKVTCFIVEDNTSATFNLEKVDFNFFHYSWEDFKKELGENNWIIPRHNASIRSFGFFQAYKRGFEIIVTLDDDCYPVNKYLNLDNHDYFDLIIKRLTSSSLELEEEKWETTVLKIRSRGFPYKNENLKIKKTFNNLNVILNHGLWANIPDLDSVNQMLNLNINIEEYFIDKLMPRNKYFTMCGMNLAFKKEAVPALYFLLMGEDEKGNKYPYDRFDDIWAGIFFKKICDHLNYDILSGHPIIWHDRASNPFKNLQKEASGIEMNEKLWKIVDEIKLTKNTFKECYKELAEKLPLDDNYFSRLKRAMIIWSELF